MKLFRVTVSAHRTKVVAPNDLAQDSTAAAEEFHRELKQLTGVKACPVLQSAHPAQTHSLRMIRVKTLESVGAAVPQARCCSERHTIYQIKHGMLSNHLSQDLK